MFKRSVWDVIRTGTCLLVLSYVVFKAMGFMMSVTTQHMSYQWKIELLEERVKKLESRSP